MIFYEERNVYEAALDRIRYIFKNFYPEHKICVTISGGKDSTVVLHLTKEVMDELGIPKIPVLFLDQEAEMPQTIEYMRWVMSQPWVEPYWVQTYFREWNASAGEWFNVWGPGEQWCREKEPNCYENIDLGKTNTFFTHTLGKLQKHFFGKGYISLGGVRIEESPARLSGLTHGECIPGTGITWGAGSPDKGCVLYPIWDWKVEDVWYYIFSKGYKYCSLYNYQFTTRPLRACRVSSLIHENAIHDVNTIKEVAPAFYDKLCKRVKNFSTTWHTHNDVIYYAINGLPPYFKDWEEYVDYVADNLCENPTNAERIKHGYRRFRDKWIAKMEGWQEGIDRVNYDIGYISVVCVLAEDFPMSRFQNTDRALMMFYNEHYKDIKNASKIK